MRCPVSQFCDSSGALPSRVNVIGASGSGKSTFARELAGVLGVPCVEMDQLFWGPDWAQPSDEEFFVRVRAALAVPGWVLDGNYTRTIPIKWEQVEWVIWLDYPFVLTIWQAVKRAMGRAWTKQEIWPGTGNRESFRQSLFSRKSIIWWAIKTHRQVRKKYEQMMAAPEYASIRFLRLRSHIESADFLNQLRDSRTNGAR